MDELDKKLIGLLRANARATIKELAGQVALTPPAVSERIRRLERDGVISGYTVLLNPDREGIKVQAIISIYVPPKQREKLHELVEAEDAVEQCYQVTGPLSHMFKVSCRDIGELDDLISRLQKLGQTNTQIILSTVRGSQPLAP